MRSLLLFVFVAAAISFGALVPIPNSFRARGYVDFSDKLSVYATQTSTLTGVGQHDRSFEKDDVILQLECPEKVLELKDLDDEIASVKLKYALLKKSAVNDSVASFELPSLLELAKELVTRRNLIEPELKALVFRAPENGFFIPAATKISPAITPPNHIEFTNPPLHSSNLGCTVERGALLGWFSTKSQVAIQTLVPEADIKSLRIGMSAVCILDSEPSRSLDCLIKKIAPEPVEGIPTELFGDPMIVAVRNQKGGYQADSPHYLILLEKRSPTEGTDSGAIKGARASVHFQLEPKTIAVRIGDYLRSTFRPK